MCFHNLDRGVKTASGRLERGLGDSAWLQWSGLIDKTFTTGIRVVASQKCILDGCNQATVRKAKALMLRHVSVATPITIELQQQVAVTRLRMLDQNRQSQQGGYVVNPSCSPSRLTKHTPPKVYLADLDEAFLHGGQAAPRSRISVSNQLRPNEHSNTFFCVVAWITPSKPQGFVGL